MPTACVEEGDSVLEWGYLLQGCGLTRLLGPSLYLWASFWNCGAKSRTVLKKKKIKNAGHKNLGDIVNVERARRTEPHTKCRIVYLEVIITQTFALQIEMELARGKTKKFLLVTHWLWVARPMEMVATILMRMIVPVEVQQCQQHYKVQLAGLGLPVSRTCHLGEGHGKAAGHKGKWEPIWLRVWKTSPVQSSKAHTEREANCSL